MRAFVPAGACALHSQPVQTKPRRQTAGLLPRAFAQTLRVGLLTLGLGISLSAAAEDLVDILRLAKANDAGLNAARSQLMAERQKYPQARAALLPLINASYQKLDQTSEFTAPGIPNPGPVDTKPSIESITLTQPLFRFQAFKTFEQSKLLLSKAELDFANAEQDLMLRVSQAYFDILTARDTITVIETQKAAISEQLAAAKRNFEVGTSTITDQQEAQARFDLALAQEIAARNDLEIKRAALQNLIGRDVPTLAPLRSDVTMPRLDPADIDAWVRTASTNNLSVMGVKLLGEVASREIEKARAGHYPTVDLIASRSRNQNTRFGTTTADIETSAIGVQVNVPLFAGLGTQARVRETEHLQEKAQADLESIKRNAAQAARQSFAGVASGLAQINALKAAEKSSQLALESNKLGYQVGVRINIDVLNAQQQLSSTQRDLLRARYETLINGLRLKASAGGLRDADLLTVNRLLDATSARP